MTSATSPKAVLSARGLFPKKALGQNFLTDAARARHIAELATTPPGGTVLEIGAGLGALTEPLLERAARVVAVERDRDLVPLLRERFSEAIDRGALDLRHADARDLDLSAEFAGPAPHVLAGNLPYAITGLLLRKATQLAPRITRAVFLVQLEVARRLVAQHGTPEYGALTVFVRAAFDVRRDAVVRSGAFFPVPKVDSAVVVLERRDSPLALETEELRALVRAAFQKRRKTLRNAWTGVLGLDRPALEHRASGAGIDLDARGETLSVEDFARMAEGVRT